MGQKSVYKVSGYILNPTFYCVLGFAKPAPPNLRLKLVLAHTIF
jgi:hypothetical protein